MNKNSIIFAILALSFLAIGCSKTEKENNAEKDFVTVQLSVSAADAQGGTRSDMPLFPEQENWIWDFYYVQYDNMGRSAVSGHIRANATQGLLSVSENVLVRPAEETTILVVANIDPYNGNYGDLPVPSWQVGDAIFIGGIENEGFLSAAKVTKFDMTKRLTRDAEGHYSTLKHMPMCGYWKGSIPEGTSTSTINIALGRMVARMNVNITNNSDYDVSEVTLNNVAKSAYVYPQASNTPLAAEDYLSSPVTQSVSIPHGTSKTLYFYTAPNYCDADHITSIQFRYGSKVSPAKQLGSYIVSETEPEKNDYNLYMNTIYTYNIELTR